ncbi:conjugal transfer protein TraB [Orientia tsutsugamushi]|uniref:Conjugal transfer protein TraB n=1 Tax=Orientia tsutsugamushi TaxID=784 RepID=A0A2R8EZ48_ORITS|nr:hypothetical protein [Orientia tsutsugamushi]SPM44395.1 conjugal transfer protein TraB [Orientia tsutsugamushi]
MNHLFKQNAIQELVKYNKCLLSVHDNKTEQAPVVVKPFVNLKRAGSEPKKMLRTMLLAVVLLELSCLLKSL